MQAGRIEGATRVLGQDQGYLALPIRDDIVGSMNGGDGFPVMLSAWHPTPAELADIVNGAPILLYVVGTQHPPVAISVGVAPAMVDSTDGSAWPTGKAA